MEKVCSYKRVYQDIKDGIASGRYRYGDRLPTEVELQETYGVSRITVKKAMELLGEDSLIQRFPGKGTFVCLKEESAPSAQSTAGRGPVIGVVMSDFSPDFGQRFLQGVSEEANRQGCGLMVGLCYSSLSEESAIIDRMQQNGVNGIIAMAMHSEYGINTGIVNSAIREFPLVLADRYLEGIPLPYIGSDHADAAFKATQYLFSLGHKNIGLISSAPTTTAITERESGYMKSYAMTKYQVYPSYLLPDIRSSMPGQMTQENIRRDVERVKAYFRDNPGITALLCIDYNIMKVCETAALEMGLRIPDDLSLVSFDTPEDGYAEYEYTHIRQPERNIGVQSVQMLLDVIGGNREPKYLLLPTELCIGKSTAKPSH